MSKASFQVPNDRICIVLFGLAFALIGIFPVLIFASPVLLGIDDVPGEDFWGTLLLLVLVTLFAVIGISEMIRGLTVRSDPLGLRMPKGPVAAGTAGAAAGLDAVFSGARIMYTWGFRVILLFLVGIILVAGLYFSSVTLSTLHWSDVRPTIWPVIYAVMLVLPTFLLVFLNLRARYA